MLLFEFTRPILLLLTIPLGIVFGLWFVRSLSDFSRPQRVASLIVRSIIALLIVLSLAGLTWLRHADQQYVLIAVDESLSVGQSARNSALEYLKAAADNRGRHRLAWMPFAVAPGPVRELSLPADLQKESFQLSGGASLADQAAANHSAAADSHRDGTNLSAAIQAAAGYLPPGYVPHIVLLTDGNETEGNAVAAALQSRIPVSTIPLPPRAEPEVQVSEVSVPAEVREGEPFFIDVTIHSNHDDEGLLEVFRGDYKVISEIRKFKEGKNQLRFQQSVERDRMAAIRVRVSGLSQDTLLDNNTDAGLVSVSGKPRVLIVESDPPLIRELVYALEDEGIQTDVRPPQGMPETLEGLQNYELLILSNVPATAMTQQQMELVRIFVQELGGGFLMLGGEQSFGLGGYYRSTIEEILPVRSDFEKEKEKPSLAMVLVIDRSGSMEGEKIDMAQTAARSAVELLSNRDQVAVLSFDSDTHVVSEMQSATNKGRIADQISSISPGGGTNMFPALETSFEMLSSTAARLKHVILLTDGISNSGDFEGMAQQMTAARMTVSTVAIGGDGETDTQLLQSIARIGRGRYYLTEDPAQIPQIFARETMTASKSAIDEEPFLPQVIRATHALAEIDLESAPFLLGHVMTRAKPTAEVVLATEKGDPLLVWWRYGLGMTAAFTSDAKTRWAAEWMTWPGYGKFWTQIVRQIMRKNDSPGLHILIARHGTTAVTTVDAATEQGRFLNDCNVGLTVINPQLQRNRVRLIQTAPGRYSAEFMTPLSGSYHLEYSLKKNDQELFRQTRGLMVGYSDELRIHPADNSLLQDVAAVSGGKFNPPAANLFERPGAWVTRPTPLWKWLLTSAAFLLVADVALRRIDLLVYFPISRFRSTA